MSRSVRHSNPGSKDKGFTIQVQRCCTKGCSKPGTHRTTVSPRGAAALETPPDEWAVEWYCDEHYEKELGSGNPNILESSW